MLLKSHLLRKRIERTSKLVRKTLQKSSRKIFVKKEKQKKQKTNKKTHLQLRNYFLAKHVLVWSPFFV